MKKEEFRIWLAPKRTKRAISDCISRCAKIEKSMSIDLDLEFEKDYGFNVMKTLSYGKKDMDQGVEFPGQFVFKDGANRIQRITDLRASAKQYFLFCEWYINKEKGTP